MGEGCSTSRASGRSWGCTACMEKPKASTCPGPTVVVGWVGLHFPWSNWHPEASSGTLLI